MPIRRSTLYIGTVILLSSLFAEVGLVKAQPARTIGGNEMMAKADWILRCQGCHGPRAEGSTGGAPSMNGLLARFLSAPGGREYLGRVPGVVNSGLTDRRLANLLNWILFEFDPAHIPKNFVPYTTDEIANLRRRPLVSGAAELRARLLRTIE